MTRERTEYPLVNISRLVMALAVVAIHLNPLSDIWPLGASGLSAYATRIAVPFFFMVSGFFAAVAVKRGGLGRGILSFTVR